MPKESKYSAPALDKGLDILEHLSAVGGPLAQGEIAQALGRSPNEIFRMLSRLEDRNYIRRDPVSGKYQLTLKLYHLSHTHSPVESLVRMAAPFMRELVLAVGHPVHLSIIDGDSLLVVSQVRSPNPVTLSIAEGSRFPLVSTTSGQLLLGSLPEAERDALLAADGTWLSWSKRKQNQFVRNLAEFAAAGHHASDSQLTRGVTDISVRVGQPGQSVLAALAVSCVSSVLGSAQHDPRKIRQLLQSAARQIEMASGLHPDA